MQYTGPSQANSSSYTTPDFTLNVAYAAVYQQQGEEIAYLKKNHPNHELWTEIDALDVKYKNADINLLAARNKLLDALNESLIRKIIDINTVRLSLNGIGITRLPDNIFRDPSLKSYWENLVYFDCCDNRLREMPESIEILKSLEVFFCGGNQLRELPNSICNLKNLETLCLYNNQLCKLPELIGELLRLGTINCPKNELQSLPSSVLNKFGKKWCDSILKNQKQPLPEQPVLLTQFIASNNQRKPWETPANLALQTSGSEEVNTSINIKALNLKKR